MKAKPRFNKNEDNYKLFNFIVKERKLHLFDLRYSLKLIAISVLITQILVILGWQSIKPAKQQSSTSSPILSSSVSPSPSSESKNKNQELIYNVKQKPQFQQSQELQMIVAQLVDLAKRKGMSTEPLSITLIDVKSGKEASYQQEKLRYPASVVKLYWLVILHAQLNQRTLLKNEQLNKDLIKMIQKSDNEAASRILDQITYTQSGSHLNSTEFNVWLEKRQKTNRFFQTAGYQEINISQKTFPIPYLNLFEPQGRELQMRGFLDKPIRNKITTQQTSRLMYEIATQQAVSVEDSKKMLELLSVSTTTRINNKANQNPNIFNNVRGFFSQSLPDNVYFAGKAGWTSNSRTETAYITTKNGEIAYILTIFAEDRSYAYDWNIFPEMSKIVFEYMNNKNY